jgi:hypothetical protein
MNKKRQAQLIAQSRMEKRTARERAQRRLRRQKESDPEHPGFHVFYAKKAIQALRWIRATGKNLSMRQAHRLRKKLLPGEPQPEREKFGEKFGKKFGVLKKKEEE